ncbi:IclR family transcriptional regulator C-terminal domain-containing protein [Pseudomonas sp. CT11-2]|uniref:IclR family transcriptional regulator domain-containing protein n=1 Tax=Pseudomonas sp. CT11-2 TaxID=3243023 RepID=UPI0039B07D2F
MIMQQVLHVFTPEPLATVGSLCKELAQIRADGVSFNREEYESGIICIAAPAYRPRTVYS